MIRAEFFVSGETLIGFEISGHSGYAESGSDIVCAAVSSAVQLTANLLENFECNPQLNVCQGDSDDNVISCHVGSVCGISAILLKSLKLHICAVSEEYPKTIKIITTEV